MKKKEMPTYDVLYDLVINQKLSHKQIGKICGSAPTTVANWKIKYGIRSLEKWELNETAYLVEPIEGLRKSLLVGSLLGDGGMILQKNVPYFHENHGAKEEFYMRWKCDLWGENWMPRKVVEGKETFEWENGDTERSKFLVRTISHPLLTDWYYKFYTGEKGTHQDRHTKEILDPCIIDDVDEFALTIWYLDDGNAGHFPSICFGMKEEQSIKVAHQILDKFGLKYKWHPSIEGRTGNFQIGYEGEDESSERFHRIISPHVPKCMGRKLQWGNHIGPTNIAQRICEENHQFILENINFMSRRKMSLHLNIGEKTLHNYLKKHRITVNRSTGKRGQTGFKLFKYKHTEWINKPTQEQEQDIEEIYKELRGFGFPEDENKETLNTQYQYLKERSFYLKGGEIRTMSKYGLKAISRYFPHRYDAIHRGDVSARQAWLDKSLLISAIRARLKYGKDVKPLGVRQAVMGFVHTPTLFRPCNMKYMAEAYTQPNDWIWDPCMGYGGRLLGTLVAGRRYVGTEILKETYEGNVKLYEDLQKEVEEVEEGRAIFIHGKAQDFTFDERVSLVFTSPPYYDVEQYGSKKMLLTYEQWEEAFLRPVIMKAHEVLKDDGTLALNVAVIKSARKTYDIPASVLEIAEKSGFIFEDEIKMPLSGNKKKSEPILVFKKG